MLACIWFTTALILGDCLSMTAVAAYKKPAKISSATRFSAAFAAGMLFTGWWTYILAYCFALAGLLDPLYVADAIVIPSAAVLSWIMLAYRKRCGFSVTMMEITEIPDAFGMVLTAAVFVFSAFTMFYVFHLKDTILFSGYSVSSDYGPHTAMIRSFSRNRNFPTGYPHFGGQDVKYHFMFQFLAGNLELLGWKLDCAYNIPSIFAISLFALMLSRAAAVFGGGKGARVIAVALFFFRGGTALFQCIAEHMRAGDTAEFFRNNVGFIGYSEHEEWGFWNYNVYLNQRHLAFGFLVGILVCAWFFRYALTGRFSFRKLFLEKGAWKPRVPMMAVLLGLFLGSCSFWNGAAVIGTLMILVGMAVFSRNKTDFILTAAVAVAASMLQSKQFISGGAFTPQVYLGFLAWRKDLVGCIMYLFQIFGPALVCIPVLAVLMKGGQRAWASGCIIPVIFTFTFSLSFYVDINEKYLMIAHAFTCPLWAYALSVLWRYARRKIDAPERKPTQPFISTRRRIRQLPTH